MSTGGLHPAAFLVIPLGTGVQRGRQTIADHAFFGQVFKSRVQTLEAIKIVKNRFDNLINHFVINIRRRYKRRLDPECAGVIG